MEEEHKVKFNPQTDLNELLDLAAINTPPEELSKAEDLWQNRIELPKLKEILTNPAYCPSKIQHLILTDFLGKMHEFVDLGNGELHDLDEDLIEWTVKGHGTAKHEIGLFSGVVTSPRNPRNYTRGIRCHCHRPSCPICASYHNRKDTGKQTDKIVSLSKKLRNSGHGWRAGKLQHLTISPPEKEQLSYLTPEGLKKGSETAQKLGKMAGLLGAGFVFHPFRQDGVNDSDELPEEYVKSGTNSGDKLKARFSPHFHFVGFGFIDPQKVKEIYARTGWIIKALRTGKKSITKSEEVDAVLHYIKSHAGVISENSPHQPDRQPPTLNWMGALGPNSHGKVATLRIYTPQLSPVDGDPLVYYHVHGKNNDLTLIGAYEKITEFNIYTDRANRDRLRAFIRANSGYPVELLHYLDKHPDLGACALTHRQLAGLLAPHTITAEDGTLHCRQSEVTIKLHLKKGTTSGTGPADLDTDCNESPPPEILHGSKNSPPPDLVPDLGIIDYHLPPEVII